jgi:twitching motility protein PilU
LTAQLIFDLLAYMNSLGGSDLYLTVGTPPTLRLDSSIKHIRPTPITQDEINIILTSIMTPKQRERFDTEMEFNSSLDMGEYGRFRVNALRQRQQPALVIRRVISQIPSFESLHLPPIVAQLAVLKRGLILVTGMTGSGKSTTLASVIDYRNQHESGHIVTIEDPIEYFHDHKKSIITQREVGVDTESYATAMKNVLRQRPDVILVGEIRDRETMEQALFIAETGHLCLATLHTANTYQAIERVINMFPEELTQQIRLNLSMNLRAIISQRLVPDKRGNALLAAEVMLNEGLIRELILEGKITKIREIIEQNVSNGMVTFDQSLLTLYSKGLITDEVALAHADMPGDLRIKIKQMSVTQNRSELRNLDTAGLSLTEPEEAPIRKR